MKTSVTGVSRRESLRLGTGVVAALATVGRRVWAAEEPAPAAAPSSPELTREFIYDSAPFPSCHASSIVETQRGLLAAWFGGSDEGNSDVCIYLCRRLDGAWSEIGIVADGRVEGETRRFPCWNPVLFQPREGPLLLFYKIGERPNSWWGMVMSSMDQGRSWTAPQRLPRGQMGPVRAKPVQLADGTILCGSSTEHAGWQVQMEMTKDALRGWTRTRPLNRADEWGAIQPTILQHTTGELQILCRSRQSAILESWSFDSGETWSPFSRTILPNPNSGIDVVKLHDSRFLLVYNHAEHGRGMLNVAVSNDGRKWLAAHVLEKGEGEYSYPAAILTRDRKVHITYTWQRRKIRHVELDPARLIGRPMIDGQWPA